MVKSPGFESNDVGFSSQADRIWVNGNVVRQFTKPNRFARYDVVLAGRPDGATTTAATGSTGS